MRRRFFDTPESSGAHSSPIMRENRILRKRLKRYIIATFVLSAILAIAFCAGVAIMLEL